jgi:hypothetical protein
MPGYGRARHSGRGDHHPVWRYHGAMMARIRAVIDTNVVFEGLTHRGGPAGAIVGAWMAELFQACVSQAVAYEYEDVLARKLKQVQEIERWPAFPFNFQTHCITV